MLLITLQQKMYYYFLKEYIERVLNNKSHCAIKKIGKNDMSQLRGIGNNKIQC